MDNSVTWIFAGVLMIAFVGYVFTSTQNPVLKTITVQIENVAYLNSGYGTSAKTVLYFDNGKQMIFYDLHTEFQIGHSYKITYQENSNGVHTLKEVIEVKDEEEVEAGG